MKVKIIGTTLMVLGGLGFALAALLFPRHPTVLTSGMVLYTFGINWAQGLYFPEGMEILPEIKGVTASVLTSFRLFITAFIVEMTGWLYNGTIFP